MEFSISSLSSIATSVASRVQSSMIQYPFLMDHIVTPAENLSRKVTTASAPYLKRSWHIRYEQAKRHPWIAMGVTVLAASLLFRIASICFRSGNKKKD